MKPSRRNTLRRIRLASMQLAGWSFLPLRDGWLIRGPAGDEWVTTSKERAAAFAERQMIGTGLLEKKYFSER